MPIKTCSKFVCINFNGGVSFYILVNIFQLVQGRKNNFSLTYTIPFYNNKYAKFVLTL